MAEQPTQWRYGYDLCSQLEMRAGTMYPILMRLADRGLLDTDWETDPVRGRPPRHLYRLTGAGLTYAAAHQRDPEPTPHATRRSRLQTGGAT